MVMRRILDRARNVDEAVAIVESHNIDTSGGPPLHYLIADRSGRAVLVEFFEGEMVVIANEQPWHLATNFLLASQDGSGEGRCWRYDTVSRHLLSAEGRLTANDGMGLLSAVAQDSTQWSAVYEVSSGEVRIGMRRRVANVYSFGLSAAQWRSTPTCEDPACSTGRRIQT